MLKYNMLVIDACKGGAVTFFRASVLDGEPVIFPTDTIYGVGAPISSIKANEKIFELKNRDRSKPMPILISCISQLYMICSYKIAADEKIIRWLGTVWPDSNTVILEAASHLPSIFKLGETVAVRMINLPWLNKAISAINTPITATSVNISGEKPLIKAEEIYKAFKNKCKYMLWGKSGSSPSNIVDLNKKNVRP